MDGRYELYRQDSIGWTSMRNEEFQEEDVWALHREINDFTSKIDTTKDSSVLTPRHISTSTGAIMIPITNTNSNQVPKLVHQSAPLNIPNWSRINKKNPNKASKNVSWLDDDDDDGFDGNLMPPHEWIAKKLAMSQISTFSVCEGAGRTLKEFLTKRTSLFAVWVCGNCEGERMAWRGNLSRNLKELRILLCQSSPASSPTRTFIEKNYKDLKTLNPKFPILIRECRGTEPQLWARYDMGVERGVRLEGLTEEQISKTLEELVKVGAALKA